MKLLYSPASPYARKVLIVARETGLDREMEVVTAGAHPVDRNAAVGAVNPLGKIPALTLADGTVLYDSRVICEALNNMAGADLFPSVGPDRWRALVEQALGDGLLDAALLLRYETVVREESQRHAGWIAGQTAKVTEALHEMERRAADFGPRWDIGTITVACALGYLDLRFAEMRWRDGRPALAAWFEALAARPSFAATTPKG